MVGSKGTSLHVLAAGFALSALASMTSAAEKQVDFKKDIQPIFKASCVKCHSENNPRHMAAGGLRLDDKAAAMEGGKSGKDIVPGKGDESLLYKVLKGSETVGDNEVHQMPKAMRGQKAKPLSDKQIELIKTWIDQGAKWPE